jgi:hypothetical protein
VAEGLLGHLSGGSKGGSGTASPGAGQSELQKEVLEDLQRAMQAASLEDESMVSVTVASVWLGVFECLCVCVCVCVCVCGLVERDGVRVRVSSCKRHTVRDSCSFV